MNVTMIIFWDGPDGGRGNCDIIQPLPLLSSPDTSYHTREILSWTKGRMELQSYSRHLKGFSVFFSINTSRLAHFPTFFILNPSLKVTSGMATEHRDIFKECADLAKNYCEFFWWIELDIVGVKFVFSCSLSLSFVSNNYLSDQSNKKLISARQVVPGPDCSERAQSCLEPVSEGKLRENWSKMRDSHEAGGRCLWLCVLCNVRVMASVMCNV